MNDLFEAKTNLAMRRERISRVDKFFAVND